MHTPLGQPGYISQMTSHQDLQDMDLKFEAMQFWAGMEAMATDRD